MPIIKPWFRLIFKPKAPFLSRAQPPSLKLKPGLITAIDVFLELGNLGFQTVFAEINTEEKGAYNNRYSKKRSRESFHSAYLT